jgi:hypothetical protein
MNDSGEPISGFEPQPPPVRAPQPEAASGYPSPLWPYPRTISQIIDRIFFLFRTRFRLLAGVNVIPFAALFVLLAGPMGYFIYQVRNTLIPGVQPRFPWFVLPFYLFVFVLGFVVNGLCMAAGSHAALSADCGIRLTVFHCLRLAWERIGRNVGLMGLMTLYAMSPLLIILIPSFLIPFGSNLFHGSQAAAFFLLPLFILAFIGAYVWMFVLMIRLSLAFPASVAEDLPAVEAIRRSRQLTRGAKGRIFLVMLIVYAGMYVVMLLCAAIVACLAAFAAFLFSILHLNLATPWSYFGLILFVPVWLSTMVLLTALPLAAVITALAVFYRDQCLRIDGVAPPAAL